MAERRGREKRRERAWRRWWVDILKSLTWWSEDCQRSEVGYRKRGKRRVVTGNKMSRPAPQMAPKVDSSRHVNVAFYTED